MKKINKNFPENRLPNKIETFKSIHLFSHSINIQFDE